MPYNVGGSAHTVLTDLHHHGVIRYSAAQRLIAGQRQTVTAWKKAHFILVSMMDGGLIRWAAPDSHLIVMTREGREALADLDAGIDVPSVAPVGGVRFFGREAA